MKGKITLLLFSVVFVAGMLSGCGSEDKEEINPTPLAEDKPDLQICQVVYYKSVKLIIANLSSKC